MKKNIITYGTFDLFHIGHLKLLERLKRLGDSLYVGVSTDSFNHKKDKKSWIPFEDRLEIVGSIYCVDYCFPEEDWDQKISDIKKYNVSVFAMGDDWKGKFDYLSDYCEVIYLPRTQGVSSTEIKKKIITGV